MIEECYDATSLRRWLHGTPAPVSPGAGVEGGWVVEQAIMGQISGRRTPRENAFSPTLSKYVTYFWLTWLSPDQGLNVMKDETRAARKPNHYGQRRKVRTQEMLVLTATGPKTSINYRRLRTNRDSKD